MREFVSLLLGFLVILFVLAFVGIVISAPGLFVDQNKAVNALTDAGYTNITITSRDWFAINWTGCSDGDRAKFNATAINPIGKPVSVFVCAGILKGGTIRSQ